MELIVCVCWDQEERTVVEATNVPDTPFLSLKVLVLSCLVTATFLSLCLVCLVSASSLTLHLGRFARASAHAVAWQTV